MHMQKSNRHRLIALIFLVISGACTWLWFTPSGRKLCCSSIYKTFVSPDERFRVAVFRTNMPWLMFPGSAGDAPGFVRLQTWKGQVLQEQDIEAVQLIEQIRWSPTSVDIPLIAEWPLPSDVAAPAESPGK